jgi:hypothetical protein
MRRWGGNSSHSARGLHVNKQARIYLIESTGLDLDTAGERLSGVLIVKLVAVS